MSVITETKNLWDNIDGKGIAAEYSEYAERATSDEDGHNLLLTLESSHVTEIGSQKLAADTDLNGNSLELTISNNTVTAIGGKSVATIKNGGTLTDSASVDVPNNSVSTLSTTQAAITLNVNCVTGEVPNFAVEISAGAAVTLTVTKTVGSTATTLYPSEAGGTALESGKYYQVTCVGNCWTLAEFVPPTA